ncbi:hypothetical protein NECAME_12976 [Necator americanus]|uniref:UDENN FLCN/SMCR8-type domain-containing protein n=1 Tax=Necator americanus TaxID=51031 RepID=W2SZN0_NECAM|nr:hypothetical protein NECAME_12976 [Necator americanus]ETN74456.1 hypothetical protein NECAME_12976 [Necator americanus]
MTSSTIRAEDLLLRKKRAIDPFNRMGCNIDPFLAVVEFCQIQGPRPLATVSLRPNKKLASVDVDTLSVWLMSSEAASGTILMIYNQQMGIYGLSYYITMYDIKARAFQARKLRPRMQAMYDALSESQTYLDCTGHAAEDREAAEEMFLSFLQNSSLDPISDVTPCAYDSFIANLHSFLVQCSENHLRKGVLYSANTPILRFPKRTSPMKTKTSNSKDVPSTSEEETLRTVSHHLDNLLFPVLAGDDMIVCGSEQRKQTVIDFVDKINFLKPKSHPNHKVVLWTDNDESRPKGVIGVCHGRSESAALNVPATAILDANACVLRAVPYRGSLLANLSTRRRFPSDAALIAFVAASLTNISSLVYLSRFLSPLHLENENITLDDERILVNMLTELDLVKYQGLKCSLEKRRPINALVKSVQL